MFDEDFKDALIAEMMGKSFYSYCDNAPKRNMIWNLIMYYLDSSSSSVLSDVKEIARKHTISEGGGPDA